MTDRKLTEQALMDMNVQLLEANEQIREMKERLERENICLKQEIKPEANHFEIVGQSQAILRVLLNAEKVAATDSTVLLLGETGSGKELVARTIHRNSKRKARLMVNVNCAALPASLVENELFGRERGAYTGALTREIGRFELADRSTIFLDEIGELPLELQSKLLRVLQEGEFERLGSSKTIHVDVALDCRDEPRSGGRSERGQVSRGFVLSSQRISHPCSPASGTPGRHSDVNVALPARARRTDGPGYADRTSNDDEGISKLLVAWQCARTAKRDRAESDYQFGTGI